MASYPLNSKDLSTEILRHLSERQDQLRAALVCRDLRDIGLDFLWRKLDSLIPIFYVLDENYARQNHTLDISDLSKRSVEWQRFQTYASRVKDFNYRYDDQIEQSAIDTLLRLSGSEKLFPKLCILRWTVTPLTVQTKMHRLLVGPALVQVKILVTTKKISSSGSPTAASLLDLLKALVLSPDLHTLALYVAKDVSLSDNFLRLISTMRSLRHLCGGVGSFVEFEHDFNDHQLMQEISQEPGVLVLEKNYMHGLLKNLESLELNCSKMGKLSSSLRLERLQRLVLLGPMQHIVEVLDALSARHLESISVYITDHQPATKFRKLFNSIEPFSVMLTSLTVYSLPLPHGNTNVRLDWDHIFPVRSQSHYANLKHLCLWFYGVSILMDDENVRQLTAAWNSLQTVSIRHRVPHIVSEGIWPSMASLIQFAQGCPDLHYLSLDIDECPPIPLNPPVLSHRLQVLDLYWYQKHWEIVTAAHYLDCLFPWLDTRGIPGDHSHWTEMLRLIDEKRASRDTERRRQRS